MSKAVKQSILILVVLLVVSIAVALMTLLEKQKLQGQTSSLTKQIADAKTKQSELLAESKQLKEKVDNLTDQLASKDKDTSKYQTQYNDLKSHYDEISTQVDQISKERDDWKDRATTITEERDRLMKELQDRPQKVVEKIVYKEKEPSPAAEISPLPVAAPAMIPAEVAQPAAPSAAMTQAATNATQQKLDESQWAGVFKEKAALEIEIDKTKKELDGSAIQIVELKKQVSDFQLEIDQLKNEREDILRKIKYGEDLADNLSLELARAKNDQKFLSERSDKVSVDNANLLTQVKQLTTTKLALEKTIARLSNDKEEIQKKLVESESVIQSRLNDIAQVRQSIDTRMQNMPTKVSNQVELTPIVVSANSSADAPEAAPKPKAQATQGHIVSINTDNNFVIIDMGEKNGVKIGNTYRVFRGSKEIARLEVIQVRRDIAAADIKKKAAALQVGDAIR